MRGSKFPRNKAIRFIQSHFHAMSQPEIIGLIGTILPITELEFGVRSLSEMNIAMRPAKLSQGSGLWMGSKVGDG